MFAKKSFVLKEKLSGAWHLFKVVLMSTDQESGWQYFQNGGQVSFFFTRISDIVEFSKAPERSPVISSFSIADCPTTLW